MMTSLQQTKRGRKHDRGRSASRPQSDVASVVAPTAARSQFLFLLEIIKGPAANEGERNRGKEEGEGGVHADTSGKNQGNHVLRSSVHPCSRVRASVGVRASAAATYLPRVRIHTPSPTAVLLPLRNATKTRKGDGWFGWLRLREGDRGIEGATRKRHHRQCNGEQQRGSCGVALANDKDDVDDDNDDDDGDGRTPAPARSRLPRGPAWPACQLFVGPSAFCHLQPKRRVTRTI